MNSTRINTDVFDPDNIDGSYTNQIKENENAAARRFFKNSEKTGQLKKEAGNKNISNQREKTRTDIQFFPR